MPNAKPEIVGTYADNFGGLQMVGERFWISGGAVFEICSVDNQSKRLIAFNNSRNQFFPGKFSRFEWTDRDNRRWYCQVLFDAPSEQAAASGPPANSSNPAVSGCGQFAWSTLIRILP